MRFFPYVVSAQPLHDRPDGVDSARTYARLESPLG
jgi:hypothetical protein